LGLRSGSRFHLTGRVRTGQFALPMSKPKETQCLLIFVRAPETGKVKTRLAAKIGDEAALALYRSFVADALAGAASRPYAFIVYFYPRDARDAMVSWLGADVDLEAQQGEDLGERMANALENSFRCYERLVLVGTDTPDLPPEILDEAFAALDSNDAVLGPARDGGYYLIGFSHRSLPAAFHGIPWGSKRVFELTAAIMRESGLRVHILPSWTDVDTYEDLRALLERQKDAARGTLATIDYLRVHPTDLRPALSVVIPVLHESHMINATIGRIRAIQGGPGVEIIVVDGSPDADTLHAITDKEVKAITSERGRAAQMNRGAAEARGEILLFLHADTVLPPGAFSRIAAAAEDERIEGGAFDLGIDGKGATFRIIEHVATLRSRFTRLPYGDQAIFVRSAYFRRLGGYTPLPLMEDVDLMKRIRRAGGRIHIIPEKVKTSARRWQVEGVLRCTLRNRTIMFLHALGLSPQKLASWYRQ
jgi:uncharacterized protein